MNKKTLLTVLQAAVTLGLLWWVFHDPDKRREMADALRRADWMWLLVGVFVFFGCSVLSSFRWKVLLKVQGIEMSSVRTWQLFMIGMFFNLFMLGSTGGDVVKMFLAMRETKSNKAAALLSVFMDRVIGMLALIFLSVAVLYFRYDKLMNTQGSVGLWRLQSVSLYSFYEALKNAPPSERLLILLLVLLAGALLTIIGMFTFSALGWVRYLPRWTPLRGRIVEMSVACHMYAKGWRQTIWAFLVSFPLFAMFFVTFYCAARAFTDQLGLLDIFSVMPIVAVITAIPISISGIGLRESLFVSLLTPFGVTAAVATLVSVAGFLINTVGSLAGGLVFLFYRSSTHETTHLRDMAQEVDKLEDQIERSE